MKRYLFFLAFCLIPSISNASCYELSKKSIGDREDEFFLTCTNSFGDISYVVNQYFGDSESFGMISFTQGFYGFTCAKKSNINSCTSNPMGAFKETSNNKFSLTIKKSSDLSSYNRKNSSYKYPRVSSNLSSDDCYIVAKNKSSIVLGLNEKNLASNINCFVKLETYLASK